MPLDPSRLSSALRARLLAATDSHAVDNPALSAMCDAIAGAVVDELTGHATVNPLGLLAPAGTAGGPVTGTGSVQ